MVLPLIIIGIAAVAVTATALYLALRNAGKDADTNCTPTPVGKTGKTCPLAQPKTVLTEKEANDIFDELAHNKEIPFDYPVDCCYSRAHEMCHIIESKHIQCRKYWLFDKDWGTTSMNPSLRPADTKGNPISFPDNSGNDRQVNWVYHVAPMVKVENSDGSVEDRIIDPSISDKPLTKQEWEKRMGNPPGAYAEQSDSKSYFENKKIGVTPGGTNSYAYEQDPTGQKAKEKMKEHSTNRDNNLNATKRKP